MFHLPPLGDPDPMPICRRANLPLPKSSMSGLLAHTESHLAIQFSLCIISPRFIVSIILSFKVTHCAQVFIAVAWNVYGPVIESETTWSTLLFVAQCARLQLLVITDTNMWYLIASPAEFLFKYQEIINNDLTCNFPTPQQRCCHPKMCVWVVVHILVETALEAPEVCHKLAQSKASYRHSCHSYIFHWGSSLCGFCICWFCTSLSQRQSNLFLFPWQTWDHDRKLLLLPWQPNWNCKIENKF